MVGHISPTTEMKSPGADASMGPVLNPVFQRPSKMAVPPQPIVVTPVKTGVTTFYKTVNVEAYIVWSLE